MRRDPGPVTCQTECLRPITGGIHRVCLGVCARGSSNWNGSIGFKGSYIHVPTSGQPEDPGLGFGQTERLKTVTGRIYSLYNYIFPN